MPCSYVHLGLEERRRIFRLREAKVPVAEIAAALGRHRSTIHREIARNWWHDAEVPQAEGYWPLTAQDLAARRRRARAKLERHAGLRDAVVDRLRSGWSPEQIAGRLGIEPGTRHRPVPRDHLPVRLLPRRPERGAGAAPAAAPAAAAVRQEAQKPRVP